MKIPAQPRMYCYDNDAKLIQSRRIRKIYRESLKQLAGFTFKTHFNPGGIAVWGETYAKVYAGTLPVVEAYDTSMGLLVRQWDGNNSGTNHYVNTVEQFVSLVKILASKPFVRF